MINQTSTGGHPPKQTPSHEQPPPLLTFYNPLPVLYVPVTLHQVNSFNPRERGPPSCVMSDGSEYYGELLLDKPHGIGIMIFRSGSSSYGSGDRYGGGWSNGQFHGKGILVTSDFTYKGEWVDGKMHGQGRMTYNRRLTNVVLRGISLLSPFDTVNAPLEYIGEFHYRHHRHGHGVMRYVNGDVYDGEWASNRRHGQGRFVTDDGEVYEGQWNQDERHGYGKKSYVHGGEFRGTMVRDKRHGEGVMIFSNGDEYHGTFENDKIKGRGIMRYKNGDVYEGMWKDGLRNGEGKYILRKQGATVEGCFVNGLIQGRGVVQHPGVSTFVGEFERGERLHGTLFWHASAPGDKACYQGEWLGETMHNRGLLWYRNGDFFFGQFVKNKRHGPGNIRYADGSEYSGYFAKDLREGKGILQHANGSIQAGTWRGDVFVEGYDGEWDGVALNGIGNLRLYELPSVSSGERGHTSASSVNNTVDKSIASSSAVLLNTTPVMEHFGLFFNGLRHGPGILRIAGHVIMGRWAHDVLTCDEGSWEFPSGDVYVGGFQKGFREGPDGRMWFADGSFFAGNWQLDAPVGVGVFYATDHNDPIYAPKENLSNTSASSVDMKTGDGNSNKSSSFNVMGYFMEFFRPKVAQKKEDTRRVIGFHEHFVLYGEWNVASLSPASYQILIAHSASGTGSSSKKSIHSSNNNNNSNNFNVTTMMLSGSESNNGISSVGGVCCQPPASIPVGLQERHGVVVFSSGVCVRTEWLHNYPRLMLPHRPNAPFYNKINGALLGKKNSGADGLKSCSFCERPFTFFRKETFCTLCERNSCSSCLHPIEVRGHPKIEALVRQQMEQSKEGSGVISNNGLVGQNVALPMNMPACVDCARISLLDLEFNTIWIPMRYLTAIGKLENTSAINTPTDIKTTVETTGTVSFKTEEILTSNIYPSTSVSTIDESYFVYEGYTCNCVPHIYGSLWWGKEGYYLGSFDEGHLHGRGVQMIANGEKYVGDFFNDEWHGMGIYCSDDGSVYEGLWEHGKLKTLHYHGEADEQYQRHGRGESYEVDGTRYNGEWVQGQRHGTGILHGKQGAVYSGEFAFGRIEGEGRLLLQSSVFYGRFRNGKREGDGIEYFGKYVLKGNWQNDLLSGCVHIYDTVNETVYETTYQDGNERDDCFVSPVMVDDLHSSKCGKCHAAFSLFLRRHHCRLCGEVFCDNCSQRRAAMPLHFKTNGPKRVCDGCFHRIEERRMLGIKRYKNGEVYAGCWARERWVSRGLLRRADGSIVVMDASGCPLVTTEKSPPADGTQSLSSSSFSPATLTETTTMQELPPDASPSVERLRELPASPSTEVDAFSLWWTMMLSVAGLSLPLELTPCAEFNAPQHPKMKPLRLFTEKNAKSGETNGDGGDDDDYSEAAMRAARYLPSVPPQAPPFPAPLSTQTGLNSRLPPSPPPRPVITDVHIMRQVRDGRMENYSADASQLLTNEKNSVIPSSCQCHALLPPTPPRPAPDSNERIKWDDWKTRPVPQYLGAVMGNTRQGAVEWQHAAFACPFLRPVVDDVDRAVRGDAARWLPKPLVGPQVFTLIDTQDGSVVVEQKEAKSSATTGKV